MRIEPEHVRKALEDRFGVGLKAEELSTSSGQSISLEPTDVPASHSFRCELALGWRSVEISVNFGAYSRELVGAMGKAEIRQQEAFRAFLCAIEDGGGVVLFRLNGNEENWRDGVIWSLGWQTLFLKVARRPFALDDKSELAVLTAALPWASRTLGAVISLLPLEPEDENARREGAIREVLAKRYERDLINRSLCIEIHGTVCIACGFDFGRSYGEAAAGYIEVHHVNQLADLAGEQVAINPATDLVPLCGNCHAVAHLRRPPFSVGELRGMRGRET
jgi:5-methylcytosine-specific restriction protein A